MGLPKNVVQRSCQVIAHSKRGIQSAFKKGNDAMTRIVLFFAAISVLSGCATVRQQDLDAWVGKPVEALDTHSLFITIPMYKSITQSGMEVRNYVNGGDVESCFSNAGVSGKGKYASANAFTTCSSSRVVCNNIFYIRDGIVVEYAPTGRCYTDETAQPQARYRNFQKK